MRDQAACVLITRRMRRLESANLGRILTLTQQTPLEQQPHLTPEEVADIKAMRQPSRVDKIRSALNGVDPIVLVGLGLLMLLVWTVSTITQIRTSEALMLGGQKVPVNVSWGVLLQPWQLLTGTAPIGMTMPWCYGWIIESLTLIWSYALEHAKLELLKTNKLLGSIYGTVTVLLLGLNGWADYNSSPGNDPLVQGLIAGSVGLFVTTGLPVALVLLKVGFAKMKLQAGGA